MCQEPYGRGATVLVCFRPQVIDDVTAPLIKTTWLLVVIAMLLCLLVCPVPDLSSCLPVMACGPVMFDLRCQSSIALLDMANQIRPPKEGKLFADNFTKLCVGFVEKPVRRRRIYHLLAHSDLVDHCCDHGEGFAGAAVGANHADALARFDGGLIKQRHLRPCLLN